MNKTTKIVLIVAAVIVVGVIVYFGFIRKKPTTTTTVTADATPTADSKNTKYWNLAGGITNAFGGAMQSGTFNG